MKPVLILFLASVCLQACCKEECSVGELTISFEKFSISEADTLAYIKYNKGTNLTQVIDTLWECVPSTSPSDTSRSSVYKIILHNWEWKVFIPALQNL